MFDKLKAAAQSIKGASQQSLAGLKEKVGAMIEARLEDAVSLGAGIISDDQKYQRFVVEPLLQGVHSGSGGVIRLVPNFDERFTQTMLKMREQAFVIDPAANRVSLAPDYRRRVTSSLVELLPGATETDAKPA